MKLQQQLPESAHKFFFSIGESTAQNILVYHFYGWKEWLNYCCEIFREPESWDCLIRLYSHYARATRGETDFVGPLCTLRGRKPYVLFYYLYIIYYIYKLSTTVKIYTILKLIYYSFACSEICVIHSFLCTLIKEIYNFVGLNWFRLTLSTDRA